MKITSSLAEFTAGLEAGQIDPHVRRRAHLLVLDLVGSIVRARHQAEGTPSLLRAVAELGLSSGRSRVFSDPACYAPAGAALLNAALAHSLDFDDTHAAAIIHAGAPVVPAALAAAQITGASGANVIAGIIAGYEVTLRLGLALPASSHYERGFHPSATCGAFGAAAAAARVFQSDGQTIESAFGIALSQAAGTLQFLANGSWTKSFQVGWASMAGLTAACLARQGFKGATEALEGRHGFLRCYGDAPNFARVTAELGTYFELMRTGVKPYPSCRWGHTGIDAALALRKEYSLDPEEIDSIQFGLSRSGLLLIGEPWNRKVDPRNTVDAQFSGPFVIAVALTTGHMNWGDYSLIADARVRTLMSKITCFYDPDVEAEFPKHMAGSLTIAARGEKYVRKVITPKGDPELFPTVDDIRNKFRSLADGVIGTEQSFALAERILGLEGLGKASDIFGR